MNPSQIYRCFLIWQRSYRVIVVPVLLYLASIGEHHDPPAQLANLQSFPFEATHIANFWWIKNQATYTRIVSRKWPLLNTPFSLYCAQNVLTSGLIIWRIWAQHRRSKKARIVLLNGPSLVAIARILVESAIMYTAGIIVAVVLRALDHRWGYGVHAILFPTIGALVLFSWGWP